MRAESLHALILVALFIGLALAGYAAYETANPAAQGSCSFGSFFSCAKVVNSGHTTTLGVQDYVYGIVGFIALIALDIPLFRTWERRWLSAFLLLSLLGVAFSAYLFAVETFQIGAICPVCLGTYLSNGVALAGASMLWWRGRLNPTKQAEASSTDGM